MDAEDLHINPSLAEPIYRQIAEQVRRLSLSGQLAAGEGLPSVREVAACHAVNPMTVSKAYSLLEAEGVLERQRGKGMTLARGAQRRLSARERWAVLQPAIDALARQALELELPAAEVAKRLETRMQEESK